MFNSVYEGELPNTNACEKEISDKPIRKRNRIPLRTRFLKEDFILSNKFIG
jgi:hypothetical protein